MEVRFKNFVTIRGSYTQQGLSNHITFRPIKSGATVSLITFLCIKCNEIMCTELPINFPYECINHLSVTQPHVYFIRIYRYKGIDQKYDACRAFFKI
jgi:hypothetical protein